MRGRGVDKYLTVQAGFQHSLTTRYLMLFFCSLSPIAANKFNHGLASHLSPVTLGGPGLSRALCACPLLVNYLAHLQAVLLRRPLPIGLAMADDRQGAGRNSITSVPTVVSGVSKQWEPGSGVGRPGGDRPEQPKQTAPGQWLDGALIEASATLLEPMALLGFITVSANRRPRLFLRLTPKHD